MKTHNLRSKLKEMIDSLDEIIPGVSGQTREFFELVKFRNELQELYSNLDDGDNVDWNEIILLMAKFVAYLYDFSSK